MKRYQIWLNCKVVADYTYLKHAKRKFNELDKKYNAHDNLLSLEDYETGDTVMENQSEEI